MKYMLDTNVCIDVMQGALPHLAARMEACYYGELLMSAITLAELEFGILAARLEARALRRFLLDGIREDVVVASFDAAAARAYAEVRLADPQRGRNALDKLIAAHALSLGAVLVTNNEADFRRFSGLAVENWTAGG
ncbi:MAG: type II toxin-antitoxin system VapC family toxin [Pseudomonadota bacterium]|nr:type II toxin-antitoxin system VapC family toxin [Pseudomonadota bacterium]MDP1572658.1 type II toxin-antitoxin system VapC family toxin [Pseudomonadota bacterium]MDP1906531.1 type II toxin-antitoxin system VapC family toxin [Pseudomonadota bacterium]